MVYESDLTILTDFHQTDKWTLTHVLLFFFIMWNGVRWYWAVLIAYLWKGFEATEWGGYTATTPDGLIVDPLQGAMGVVVFLLLQRYDLARVSISMPRLQVDMPTLWWLFKMLYFMLAYATNYGHIVWFGRTDAETFTGRRWIFCIAAMGMVNAFFDHHTHACTWSETLAYMWAPFVYFASFGGLFFWVSSIPYNPFYASLWFHIPAFVLQAWLEARPRLAPATPSRLAIRSLPAPSPMPRW